MSATPDQADGAAFFDPFSAAEDACQDVINLLLEEGGQLLYEHYIDKKSFPFAMQATTDLLVGELAMCFVRCDEGESLSPQPVGAQGPPMQELASTGSATCLADPIDGEAGGATGHSGSGWSLEPEPPRCRIDTWARSCVPIKKKLVPPKQTPTAAGAKQQHTQTMRSKGTSNGPPTSRPASRSGLAQSAGTVVEPLDSSKGPPKVQIVPIVEHHEEDEEETGLREMKEREGRRNREEQARIQQKAADEAEEAARLAQVKEHMKNKPFTYDTNGNIIWVQPPAVHRLPPSSTVPNYMFKQEGLQEESALAGRAAKRAARRPAAPPAKQGPEFTDSFKKFASQQPAMLDVMAVAPGVDILEKGQSKSGGVLRPPGRMTRKDYEEVAKRPPVPPAPEAAVSRNAARPAGGAGGGSASAVAALAAAGAAASSAAAGSFAPQASAGEAGEAPRSSRNSQASARSPGLPAVATDTDGTVQRVVRAQEVGANLVPRPPASPRPVQPVPPPNVRRLQAKRDALGYNMSTRERVPTGTGSRFPNCAPKPPLGATMGHGLLPTSRDQMYEEYYFPNAPAPAPASGVSERAGSPAPSAAMQDTKHGQIVSSKPELTRRLFR